MAKLLEDNDYDSSEDEDYVPSAADNLKADQEIAAMNKKFIFSVYSSFSYMNLSEH